MCGIAEYKYFFLYLRPFYINLFKVSGVMYHSRAQIRVKVRGLKKKKRSIAQNKILEKLWQLAMGTKTRLSLSYESL
jgi:hypothetical protein